MIAVVDYGVGNLFSLSSSLKHIGADTAMASTAAEIERADSIILPGVGAFGDAVTKLREKGLEQPVLEAAKKGKPLLGICLGMQLLFDKSEEYGEYKGLGLIPGEIKSLEDAIGREKENQAPTLGGMARPAAQTSQGEGNETPRVGFKVPHIGWNDLIMLQECPILKNIPDGSCVYYVHSFYAPVGRKTVAGSQYGPVQISGVVQRGNIFGTQFHPEKSGEVGLNILRAFAEIK